MLTLRERSVYDAKLSWKRRRRYAVQSAGQYMLTVKGDFEPLPVTFDAPEGRIRTHYDYWRELIQL